MRMRTLVSILALLGIGACSSGGNSPPGAGSAPPPPTVSPSVGCTGQCATASSFLRNTDVQQVIAQAVNEAQAQGAKATIAVVDRVGNVLGVYRMNGARPTVRIGTSRGISVGLEGLDVPSELAAIAKAITGAYLSSEGNAFSTRTASQIVQEHFNPGESNAIGGPLFGVQFSQLPCSDFVSRAITGVGPHRSPLGLSADPGGFPLYLAGTPVGGVGIAADPDYTLDPNVTDHDHDVDELIAWAGTWRFAAPDSRRAERITAAGRSLRFSDIDFSDLARDPNSAPAFASLGAGDGALIVVPGYVGATIVAGHAFGQIDSGVRPAGNDFAGLDAFVLDDGGGNNRYPPRAASDGAGALAEAEVRGLLTAAMRVAAHARAQIRQPLGSTARVAVSVSDRSGAVLGLMQSRDAPLFGIDVAVQKARTAALFSAGDAGSALSAEADANYLSAHLDLANASVALVSVSQSPIANYVGAARGFLGLPSVLVDANNAFSVRAIGNLARPFYPDGIDGNPPGPFARPFANWSPFSDGLQLDLVYNAVARHLAWYLQQGGLSVSVDGNPLPVLSDVAACSGESRLASGIQIFPGGVPIYRGNTLVGAIGVSGDGVDQDDMVAFLGLDQAGAALGGAIGNAPSVLRVDRLAPGNTHLRYVQCPQAPFIDSNESNPCGGR